MNNFKIKDLYSYILEGKNIFSTKGTDAIEALIKEAQNIIKKYSPDSRNKFRYKSHSRDISTLISDINGKKEDYKKVMEILLELKYKCDDVRNARRVSNAETIQEEHEKYKQHFKDCMHIFESFDDNFQNKFKLFKTNLEHYNEIYPIETNSLSLNQALGTYLFLITSPTRLASSLDYTYTPDKDRPKNVEEQAKGIFTENRALQRITPYTIASTVFSSQSAGKTHFKMRLFNTPFRDQTSKSIRDFMIMSSIGNMTYDSMSYSPAYRVMCDIFFTNKKVNDIIGKTKDKEGLKIKLTEDSLTEYRKFNPVRTKGNSIDVLLAGVHNMFESKITQLKEDYLKQRKEEALKATEENRVLPDNFSYIQSNVFDEDFKKSMPFGFQKLIEMNLTEELKDMVDPIEPLTGDKLKDEQSLKNLIEGLDSFLVNDDQRRFLKFVSSTKNVEGVPILKKAIDFYSSVVTSIESTHKGSEKGSAKEGSTGLQAQCDRKIASIFQEVFECNGINSLDIIPQIGNIRESLINAYDNTAIAFDPLNGKTNSVILSEMFLKYLNFSDNYKLLITNLKSNASDEMMKDSVEKTLDALSDTSPIKTEMINSLLDTIFMNNHIILGIIKEDFDNIINILDVPINVQELKNTVRSRPLPKEISKDVRQGTIFSYSAKGNEKIFHKTAYDILDAHPVVQDSLKNVLESLEQKFKGESFSSFVDNMFSDIRQRKELEPYAKTLVKLYNNKNKNTPDEREPISNKELLNLGSFLIDSFIDESKSEGGTIHTPIAIEVPDEKEDALKNRTSHQVSTSNTMLISKLTKTIELFDNNIANSLYTNIDTYIESLPLGDASVSENIKKLIDDTPLPENFEHFMVAKLLNLSSNDLKKLITDINEHIKIDNEIVQAFFSAKPFNIEEYIENKATTPVTPIQSVEESYGFDEFGLYLEGANKKTLEGEDTPEQIIKDYLNTLMGYWVKT